MAQPVISGRTRGEYGQGLNLDSITDAQGFTFVCPTVQQFMLQLQRGENIMVDGKVIAKPDIEARFTDYRFVTKDEHIAELLRKTKAFRNGKIKELASAKADKAEEKQRKLKEQIEADPELKKALLAELKQDAKADVPKLRKSSAKKAASSKKETAAA